MQDLAAEAAVRRLIAKFANSADLKEWDEWSTCLAESIYADYSERSSTPPRSLSKQQFVVERRAELAAAKTQHLFGNVEVFINGTSATARVSTLVSYCDEAGRTSRSHCVYLLGLQHRRDAWVIGSVVEKVLWLEKEANQR